MIVTKYYQVAIESLYIVKLKAGNTPRQMAIYLAAELTNLKFNIIAAHFRSISAAGISRVVFRINKLKTDNHSIANDISNLSNQIQNFKR